MSRPPGPGLEAGLRARYSEGLPHECWRWSGFVRKNGYGAYTFGGRTWIAHRAVYEMLVGPIPPGMELDHVRARGCVHRDCVNPNHLEIVTHQENVARGQTARGQTHHHGRKTHCPQGHPYEGPNLISYKGRRYCRQCQKTAQRRWRESQKCS